MLKRLRDELSEKTKLIVYLSITLIVFASSCLLPLAFKGRADVSEHFFDTAERAAMFSAYHNKNKDVSVKVLDKLANADENFCKNRANEIISYCRIDNKSGKSITNGNEYLQLSDGENTLRLYHIWVQDEGDWTNWMDIYFDADTGFIYYLYVSSVCLDNASDYIGALDSSFNTKYVANMIAEQTGMPLKHFSWSGNAEDAGYAVTGKEGNIVCWTVNCSYYDATMLDVKIIVA